MARSKFATGTADEIAAIEDLMSDLETRLSKLNSKMKNEATDTASDVSTFVSQALSGITDRFKEGAQSMSKSVADEATKAGADIMKKVADEVEHRPLITLAVAAGIGFLLGVANRR
jgi:ElaB/YqjD/DUF883 family membrane-anchored ribosome-binding protein